MELAMEELRATKRTGDSTVVEGAAIERFRDMLRGALLLPGDAGYDEARAIWNGMIDRRPALIARCHGVGDVRAAVEFAITQDLLVSIKGGGHNVAGNAVCDNGLMIDLSPMRSVYVDPKSQTARAEGGATWADFDAETQAFGLATTGGLISSTGVAGLTLGGGIGWLTGSYGLSCDNVLSLDVITAAGAWVRASADENPDLFWGLKGGGGNFGVVTSFEFQLYPVGELFAGMVLHPLTRARDALVYFRDFLSQAPEELGALAGLVTTPDGDPALALIVVYNGPVEEGARVVQPLREFGRPILDNLGAMPYRVVQTIFDAGSPAGLRYYWKSSFLENLPDDALQTLVDCYARTTSPTCKIFLEFLGGAFARVDRGATVFDHRDATFNLLVIGAWQDAATDAENISWTREVWHAMDPYASSGVYMNYLGQEADEGAARLEAAYGSDKLARLAKLKAKYDPGNMFRMNQNIRPAV